MDTTSFALTGRETFDASTRSINFLNTDSQRKFPSGNTFLHSDSGICSISDLNSVRPPCDGHTLVQVE